MNVSATKELEEFVASKVGPDRYLSASEVVRAGLRLVEHEEELLELQRTELRKAIADGVGQFDRGEAIPGKPVFDKARKRMRALKTAPRCAHMFSRRPRRRISTRSGCTSRATISMPPSACWTNLNRCVLIAGRPHAGQIREDLADPSMRIGNPCGDPA